MTVSCPKCRAKAGSSCVYMPVAPTYERRGTQHTKALSILARVGTPTKNVHNERRDKYSRKRNAAEIRARYAVASAPPTALQSLLAFDMAEYRRLREWLVINSAVLTSPPVR